MPRVMLTNELWSKLKVILLEDKVYNKLEHRQTMEGILYRLRVVVMRLFKSLSANNDVEWEFKKKAPLEMGVTLLTYN